MDEDPIWEALADYQITVLMHKWLNLVLHFKQSREARLRKEDHAIISVKIAKSTYGLVVMDHHNPIIKIIVKGDEISG